MNILLWLYFFVLSFAIPLQKNDKDIARGTDGATNTTASELRGRGGHGGFGRGGHGGFGHGGFGRNGGFGSGRFHDRARWMMDRRRYWGPGRASWYKNWDIDRGVCGRMPRVGNVAAISYEYMPIGCGQCIAVRRGPYVDKAIVVDSCPDCGPNEVRINGGGFGMFKKMFGSSYSVDWQFVEC